VIFVIGATGNVGRHVDFVRSHRQSRVGQIDRAAHGHKRSRRE